MSYDLVVVGTGFASTFLLLEALPRLRPDARVLVLERGARRNHAWQLAHRGVLRREHATTYSTSGVGKRWWFTVALGGGSNCWWACTPRPLPEDLALNSRYGVGVDWPLSYDDLEAAWTRVEAVMQVAGAQSGTPYPMSRPYPLPPHRLQAVDERIRAANPALLVPQPCARPSRPTAKRPRCCANGVCDLCPVDSKFTILNELAHLFDDPRVELRVGATVTEVEVAGTTATGVRWLEDGVEKRADADLVALGANAVFNPWLLLRSGLDDGVVGRGLCEQRSVTVTAQLDGLDALDGSTSVTGHAYHLYGGAHRKERAAGLIETLNMPRVIQDVPGRWRQRYMFKVILEDLPEARNVVRLDPDNPMKPVLHYEGASAYLQRSRDLVPSLVEPFLAPLPVKSVSVADGFAATESHVLCTTPMGADPSTSVVDRDMRHHRVRNLLVMGGSAFPTAFPANPSLTISALSVRTARALWGPK